jgi:hypothetical protein
VAAPVPPSAITTEGGRTHIVLTRADGTPAGHPLTNASRVDDDYRFHDAFHLAHAAVLGWSPVTRFLLGRKRKSRPDTDETEDGGRAIAIEEGISALVFSYAARHRYFDDVHHIDQELLTTISHMTAHLEVGVCRAADWERAILTGYTAWKQLRAQGGGTVELDLDRQSVTVLRKLLGGPGGPGVADGSLPSVASEEWPPGSSGRLGC